jgi:hypothetical protein
MQKFLAAAFFLGAASSASAQFSDVADGEHYKIRAEARVWSPSLAGLIQKNPDGGEGTLIDVPADLGVEDHRMFQLRGILQLGQGHKIRASYTRIDYDGDKRIERQIRFGGTVYTVQTRVVTSVRSD